MLNTITLHFKSHTIEEEYRTSEEKPIKQEFSLFVIQYTLFIICYVLYYFQEATFNTKILLCQAGITVCIIFSKFLVDYQPKSTIIVLPFLQFAFALLWNLDDLFPTDTEDPNYDPNAAYIYNWYYGFQAFYFHFVVLQQGYHLIPQVFSLVGVYLWYILFYPTHTIEYMALVLTQTSVFCGLIILKYSNEKAKRHKFLEIRERSKWIYIVDRVLDQSILMVKIDTSQDQLSLQLVNQKAQDSMQIKSDAELRNVLRNVTLQIYQEMKLIDCSSTSQREQKENLESIIRKIIKEREYNPHIEYLVESKVLMQTYKVKVVPYVLNDQNMAIVVFENSCKNMTKAIQRDIQLKEYCLSESSKQLIATIQTSKSKSQFVLNFVKFQLLSTWLSKSKMHQNNARFPLDYAVRYLRFIFGSQLVILNKTNQLEMISHKQKFIILLLGLISALGKVHQVGFKAKQVGQAKLLKITFITNYEGFDSNLLRFINRQMDFRIADQEQNRQQVTKAFQTILQLGQRYQLDHQRIISLLMCKYLLWDLSQNSKVMCKQKGIQKHYSCHCQAGCD